MSFNFKEPPDKRRRLEKGQHLPESDDLWDDDDDIAFTQDELQNIDQLIMTQSSNMEQGITCLPKRTPLSTNCSRLIGRGSPRSLSANDITGGCGKRTVKSNNNTEQSYLSNGCRPVLQPAVLNQSKASNSLMSDIQNKLDKLKQENDTLKKELQSTKGKEHTKDGQIKMLRTTLASKEKELFHQRQERQELIEKQAKDMKTQHKDLQSELEKTKADLDFKDHEIRELRTHYHKLELKLVNNQDCKVQITPPHHLKEVSSSVAPSAGQESAVASRSGFPTKDSFMATELSPTVRKKTRTELSTKNKSFPGSGDSTIDKCAKMKLSLKQGRGHVPGPKLIARLMSAPAASEGDKGLIQLLQSTCSPDTAVTFPMQTKRATSPSEHNSTVQSLPKIPKSLEENMVLAKEAFKSLLHDISSYDEEYLKKSLLTCNSPQALLFLPLIEEQLTCYKDAQSALRESSFSGSDSSQQYCSPAALESVSTSMHSLNIDTNSSMPSLEIRASSSLHMLRVLVSHCSDVRTVLCNSGNASLATLPLASNQSEPVARKNSTNLAMMRIQNQCSILQCILQIVHLSKGEHKTVIIEGCLQVLTVLAQHAESSQLKGFHTLFSNDILRVCLGPSLIKSGSYSTYIHVMDLISALAQHSNLLHYFCTKSDDCLLYTIYMLGISTIPKDSRNLITYKIITCLGNIISQHRYGAKFLLETDCNCSIYIIKSVVLMLHYELLDYQEARSTFLTTSSKQADLDSKRHCITLLQGAGLLHSLCLHDHQHFTTSHADVQHQYVELVCTLEQICKEKEMDSELDVNLLHDLWDFEEDDSLDEDDI